MGQACGIQWKWHIFCCLITAKSWEVTDHGFSLFSNDGWTALLAQRLLKGWSMFGKSILRRLNCENPARLNWTCVSDELSEVYSSPRLEEALGGTSKCMSLAVGQGRSNTPHPRSLEYRQQKVFGICFFTNILCLLLPSIHLSLLNSEVVSLLFHAAQKDLVQVLPCESKLQILQNPIG